MCCYFCVFLLILGVLPLNYLLLNLPLHQILAMPLGPTTHIHGLTQWVVLQSFVALIFKRIMHRESETRDVAKLCVIGPAPLMEDMVDPGKSISSRTSSSSQTVYVTEIDTTETGRCYFP